MFRSASLDADMDDEMRFHVEIQTERLIRERGLDAAEARRQALVAFGGVEKYREAGRDTRGVRWLDAVRLDARLAGRMLLKYPALTVIGGFAMAVAIAIGASTFEVVSEWLRTDLPIAGGERVVGIRFSDRSRGLGVRAARHFSDWRQHVQTVRELSAFRTMSHNLVVGDGFPEAIRVAEITASAFDVARTPPVMGRYLQPQDEAAGAPSVMVIGHDVWRSRFGGDPSTVGRDLKLGTRIYTVVGVMPAGFKFPISYDYWIPLKLDDIKDQIATPDVYVFGRLARDTTLERARAEVAAIGQRIAASDPARLAQVQLEALPFTHQHGEIDSPQIEWAVRLLQLLIGALLVIVALNLAILMYARTVTRLGEIAIRTALGASRLRLLSQLFIEALALSLVGAAAGLVLADFGLATIPRLAESGSHIPFWITFRLSLPTVGYGVALAIVAALIIGVLPGLRATGGGINTNLRNANGGNGRPLGALWTTLIVTQVAIAAAVLPLALHLVSEVARMEFTAPSFPAERYLLAKVDDPNHVRAIVTRLESDAEIERITVSSNVPGYTGSRFLHFEQDGPRFEVDTLDTAIGLFGVYDARIIAGRDLIPADVGTGNVVVSRALADELLNGPDVLGRPFRFTVRAGSAETPRTHQIVGIVEDFPKFPPSPMSGNRRVVYHAATIGANRAILTIRYRTAVTPDMTDRLRQMVAAIDPSAPLRDVTLLTEFYRANRAMWRLLSAVSALLTASVLLLSAAGIYALMSFTVAQRTREIGIRSALGANPRRLLAGIFGRVLVQLSAGLSIGLVLSGGLIAATLDWRQSTTLFLAVTGVVLIVGLSAAIGPARRGLRIEPTEALRTDA